MEIGIERSELLAGLYLVQGVVERRTTIPILANVLLQTSGEGVSVAATDNEVGIRRQCAATTKKKGSITTGARRLYEIVREFPEGEIRIRSLDNYWVEVSSGRSRFRLMGLDPREFPAIPEPSPAAQEQAIRVSAAVLSEMIEYTVFAVSADETRANLNGIFVECAEPGRVRMVATDGHRLAMVTRSVERAELSKGMIIARKAIMEMRKVIEGGGEEPVTVCVEGGVAHAERGPVQLSMRLVEGEFPDYQQVVPAKSGNVAEVPNARLAAALRRVSIVSSERTRGVKLQFQEQKLEISSINPDVGEGSEEIEVEYEGPPVAIGFNARYLIDALSVLPAENPIEIALSDEVSPGVVRQGGDPDYCYIVMPMRL